MSLVISDEILEAARMSADELRREMAVMLFAQEKLSLGKAAEVAGMTRLELQHLLASRRIPVHYDVKELEADLQVLRDLGPA